MFNDILTNLVMNSTMVCMVAVVVTVLVAVTVAVTVATSVTVAVTVSVTVDVAVSVMVETSVAVTVETVSFSTIVLVVPHATMMEIQKNSRSSIVLFIWLLSFLVEFDASSVSSNLLWSTYRLSGSSFPLPLLSGHSVASRTG